MDTQPIPKATDIDYLYQQLVAELGDPYDNEAIEDANRRYLEGKAKLGKFIRDMYLAEIEPQTTEMPFIRQLPRKHKK